MSEEKKEQFDASLSAFGDLPDRAWRTLLVGNGYSINLWKGFAYRTLRDEAALSRESEDLFEGLGSINFEEVLEAVHHAHLVLDALGADTADVDDLYGEVRDALFDTIRDIHVPWERVPEATHRLIAEALANYDAVFTTNYDLTAYWSYVQELSKVRVADLFWGAGNTFNPDRTEVWRGWTALYYLHGAIHLWQDADGENGKWRYADGGNLLGLAGQYGASSSRRPLFVSEGTWEAKRQAIRQSAYLSHCFEVLREDDGDTIVVGHSLSDWDEHIVSALARGRRRHFAISIYPHQSDEQIVQTKARVTAALKPHWVHFFDSETHPLGDPALEVS